MTIQVAQRLGKIEYILLNSSKTNQIHVLMDSNFIFQCIKVSHPNLLESLFKRGLGKICENKENGEEEGGICVCRKGKGGGNSCLGRKGEGKGERGNSCLGRK